MEWSTGKTMIMQLTPPPCDSDFHGNQIVKPGYYKLRFQVILKQPTVFFRRGTFLEEPR